MKYIPTMKLIELLEAVYKLDMFDITGWQHSEGLRAAETFNELLELRERNFCGTTACIGGHVAIDPWFQKTYGVKAERYTGAPYIIKPGRSDGRTFEADSVETMSDILGVGCGECALLLGISGSSRICNYYGVASEKEITARHVILKLYELMNEAAESGQLDMESI